MSNSIKGFRFNGNTYKYDYTALDNAPNVETDKTLAITDRPADAKAVGDEIASIRNAVGTPLTAETASGMTDRNKIYVYTGSETGYTNGNWYYFDTAQNKWVSGGTYNSAAIDTDDTLTYAGKAADAKAVGDEVTNLKSAITYNTEVIKDNLSHIYGKNLFNPLWLVADGITISESEAYGKASDFKKNIDTLPIIIPSGEYVAISFEAYVEPTQGTIGSAMILTIMKADGITTSNTISVPNTTSEWTQFTSTPNRWAGVNGIKFLTSQNTANVVHIRKIQVEIAQTPTTYENPLTGYDKAAENDLTLLKSYKLNSYEQTKANAFEAFSYFFEGKVFVNAGSAIRANTGVQDSGFTSYSCSNYIFIPEGGSVEYAVRLTNQYACALAVYNIDKEYTDIYLPYTSTIGTWTATEDCYIRVSTLSSDVSTSYIKLNGKENIEDRIDEIQDVLPSYWETYLNGKKSDINSFISAVGCNGTYFALFTDYHQTQNTGWTPRIIKNIIAQYPVDDVFNLGDDYGSETTVELAIERLNTVAEMFKPIALYNCAGNHDSNPYGAELTEAQWYNPLFRETETKQHVATTGHGYYYIDNPVQKIRYIVLNTRRNGFTVTDNDDTIQIPWFISVLNSVEDGWHVCVMMHMAFEWYKDENDQWYMTFFAAGNLVKAICDGYQNRATGTTPTEIQVLYDFTNAHGKMACVLSGHTHAETSVTSDAGYPIIAFDRDAMYYPPVGAGSSRTEGTVTEQALYLVSINTSTKKVNVLGLGAGTDREFSFT